MSGYEVSFDGGGFIPGRPPSPVFNLGEGTHTFQVRAIETPTPVDPPPDPAPDPSPVTGPAASITVRVDRTPPDASGRRSTPASPNGSAGWYRSLRIDSVCADPGGFPALLVPGLDTIGDRGVPDQGPNQVRTGTARSTGLA